jgi:hypothetical protein
VVLVGIGRGGGCERGSEEALAMRKRKREGGSGGSAEEGGGVRVAAVDTHRRG